MADQSTTPTTTPIKAGMPTKAGTPIAPRDAELMFRVVQNMKDKKLEVDWVQVAKEMGYKSATVASTRFRQVRKNMETSFESPSSAGGSGVDLANTPTKAPKAKAAKVTKPAAKARAPKKGVAYPVNKNAKGVKSAETVTKEDDSGFDNDMEDEYDEEDSHPAKLEDDDYEYVAKRKVSDEDSYDMFGNADEEN